MPKPRIIQTLGDLPYGGILSGWCGECRSKRPLDRLKLYDRLGPAVTLDALAGKLRCTRCGNRKCSVRFDPPPER